MIGENNLKILCSISARGGSKGVPGKNIKPLGGDPLITYPIKSALRSKYIDKVVVSTDANSIAEVAKEYGAVCTPDFFGYNDKLELQYRGRIRELKNLKAVKDGDSELKIAMKKIAETGKGPKDQIPSMGCNIKWFK